MYLSLLLEIDYETTERIQKENLLSTKKKHSVVALFIIVYFDNALLFFLALFVPNLDLRQGLALLAHGQRHSKCFFGAQPRPVIRRNQKAHFSALPAFGGLANAATRAHLRGHVQL